MSRERTKELTVIIAIPLKLICVSWRLAATLYGIGLVFPYMVYLFHHCVGVFGLMTPFSLFLVRQKSREIISFLQDEERLREARKTAKTNRDKYVGISNDETKKSYSKCAFGGVCCLRVV